MDKIRLQVQPQKGARRHENLGVRREAQRHAAFQTVGVFESGVALRLPAQTETAFNLRCLRTMDEGIKKSEGLSNWVIVAVLLCIVMLIIAIVLPNFIPSKTVRAKNACINNLLQIEGAKQQWALEHDKSTNDVPTWADILPYIGRGAGGSLANIYCPDDPTEDCTNSYILGDLLSPPQCRISPTKPSHRWSYLHD